MNGRSLGLLLAAVGASVAPLRANGQVAAVSIDQTNVYYDLASLYGDTDQDGVLSPDEYNAFDPESLKLHTDKRDTWLGWIPTENRTYFYFFSRGSSSPWTSSSDLQEAKKKASQWSYRLSYLDSVKQDADGNVIDGAGTAVDAELANFYHGSTGFFYNVNSPQNYTLISSVL